MTVSLIPISLMVYAITSLYQKPTKPMVADYLSFFAFGCAWVTTALQSGSIIVRLVLLLPLVAFLCVFLVGNKLCVRFFRDWVHHEMLLEWRNGAPIAWDAFSALKAWDWIGGVAGPMLFVAITVGSVPPALPAWSIGAWLALAVVAALMHAKLRQRDFDPEEHNPFMNFLRGWLSELRRMNDQKAESLGEDILPSVATGYSRAGVPSFPLIQEPVGDAPSPRITAPDGGPINVVMIVLESVRAFECGVYGAPTSFSPEFDALAREGMLVRQFYANGSQTARGELSLLCSYYDHFRASPLYLRNPALRLRSLPEILRDRGYKTNWISSHTADYCNKRGFLTRHGVDQIYDDVHLPPGLPKINWGPPDEDLFRSAIGVLDKQTGPFFAEIMSLTNHWPFEGPYPTSDRTPEVTTDKSYRDYTRGVFYTDHALGQFIREAKTKPWFNDFGSARHPCPQRVRGAKPVRRVPARGTFRADDALAHMESAFGQPLSLQHGPDFHRDAARVGPAKRPQRSRHQQLRLLWP